MLLDLKKRISSFFKLKLNDKKLGTYSLFLFISLSFWFLSMLSKDHETTLELPISYLNLPADKVLLSSPLSFVEVRVKAPGFAILLYTFFNNTKLDMDVEMANMKLNKSGSESFWIMNSNRRAISDILSSSIDLITISPQRLSLIFSDNSKKKVAVKLNSDISFGPEIWLANPISLDYDSLIIYGSMEQLDSIDFILTKELLLSNVSENRSLEVPLIIPNNIKSKLHSVNIDINVESFVEQLLICSVNAIKLKDGYSIKLFPNEIEVTVRTSKKYFGLLQADLLDISVDASLITSQSTTLDIYVRNSPTFLQLKMLYPSKVEFLLVKD